MMNEQKVTQRQRQLTTPHSAGIAGIIAGVLFITSHVLILISLPTSQVGPGIHQQTQKTIVAIALQLLPFAGIAFLWFMGVMRDRIGKREDQFYSTVFMGSGLLYLAMSFTAAALAGGLRSFYFISQASEGESLYTIGESLVSQITNVFGLRMAAVFMLSSAAMWVRTGVVPRWLAIMTALLGLLLLITIGLSLWLALIFPVWMLIVSVLILISNYRRKTENSESPAEV